MAIKEGLKKRIEIEDEMSEMDFDQATFDMEMGCLPFGSTEDAFYNFDDISQCRRLKNAVYSPLSDSLDMKNIIKNCKVPDLVPGERRILSVDIALMASTKHNNDATSIIINSAIPTNNAYIGNIIFIDGDEGLRTDELALKVRRLYKWFKCTDLTIDTAGQGLGVYDEISKDIIDPATGELYPALSCCNDEAMADRCLVKDAEKVVWSVKGNAAFNNEICVLLRNGFKSNKINLLVSEFEAEDILRDKVKDFSKLSGEAQTLYKMPYTQTTLLVYELISLDYKIQDNKVKIIEKSGKRKDRYSSLAYNYWTQCQLEKQLRDRANNSDLGMREYANKLRKLNRKPRSY